MAKNTDIHGKPYNLALMIVVLMVGTFCVILNQTLLATAFPTLMKDFNISTSTVQWLTSGFILVAGIMIPISTWLTVRVPSKRLYIAAMGLFLAGTITAYLAPNFGALLTGRLIQALGVGITMPMLQTLMLTIFPVEKRGASMGLAGLVIGLAPALGPTLSGWVIDQFSWRALFGMMIPIIAAVLIASFFFMKDVMETKKVKLDILSAILSTVGFGGLLYGFSSVGDDGFGSAKVISFIAVGLVTVILFVIRQLHMKEPFLELRVFKQKEFTISAILVSVVMMAMIAAEMVIPLYLQTVRGDTAFESGLTLLAGALLMGIMSPITGKTFDKHGAKHLAVGGLILLTAGTVPFIFLTMNTPTIYIVALYAVRMFGIAMVMMPITTSGMNSLPQHLISHGTGVNNTVRQVASSIGTAVLISVLSNVTKTNMPVDSLKTTAPLEYKQLALNATLQGYHTTFLLASLISLVAIVIAFFLKDKRAQQQAEAGAETETEINADLDVLPGGAK